MTKSVLGDDPFARRAAAKAARDAAKGAPAPAPVGSAPAPGGATAGSVPLAAGVPSSAARPARGGAAAPGAATVEGARTAIASPGREASGAMALHGARTTVASPGREASVDAPSGAAPSFGERASEARRKERKERRDRRARKRERLRDEQRAVQAAKAATAANAANAAKAEPRPAQAPVTREAASVARADESTGPSTRDAAPVMREAAPTSRGEAPATRDAAPPTREAAPTSRDAAPATRDAAPVTHEAAPVAPAAVPAAPSMPAPGPMGLEAPSPGEPIAATGGARDSAPAPASTPSPAFPRPARPRTASRSAEPDFDEFGYDPAHAGRWQPFFDFLYDTYWRVDAQGLEHVPASGPAVLVANHSGTLPYDWVMLMTAVRRQAPRRLLRPLIEDVLYHFPYSGRFITRLGGVRACPENAERLLRHDAAVAVFPEGVQGIGKLYRERYQLQRFGRGGFVKLALRTGAPLVPVAVVGGEETFPLLAKVTWLVQPLGLPYVPVTPTFPILGPFGLVPLPSKWAIRVAEPIHLEGGPDAAEDRIYVNRVADRLRGQVQAMVSALLRERRGAFR